MQRLSGVLRTVPLILGASSIATVAVLFVRDAFPGLFPPRAHDLLGALPLVFIAFSYLAYQVIHRRQHLELLTATILPLAFLFWAANQLWPDLPQPTVLNDVAIALFVLDVLLVIVRRVPKGTGEATVSRSQP